MLSLRLAKRKSFQLPHSPLTGKRFSPPAIPLLAFFAGSAEESRKTATIHEVLRVALRSIHARTGPTVAHTGGAAEADPHRQRGHGLHPDVGPTAPGGVPRGLPTGIGVEPVVPSGETLVPEDTLQLAETEHRLPGPFQKSLFRFPVFQPNGWTENHPSEQGDR